jgi:dihydrofolate synthase / folylpolyglutamate synthase
VRDIAEEKLAVLLPDTTLVLGGDLAQEALAVAERVAREQDARIVPADRSPSAGSRVDGSPAGPRALGAERPAGSPAEIQLAASGPFQRRNFALARTAAETYLRELGIEPREDAVRGAAAETVVQGRLQIVAEDPLTVLDGAHNPDATRALIEALPEVLDAHPPAHPPRPLALVLGVLEDKDAASMLRALLGVCERAWFTAPPSSRALSPAALQSLARQLGFNAVVCEPEPARALAEAQHWARERGAGAAVLATGSVYLVGDLLAHLRGGVGRGLADGASASPDRHLGRGGGRR